MLKRIRNFLSGNFRINGCVVACAGICAAVFITEQQYNQQKKSFYRRADLERNRLLRMRHDPTPLYGKFRIDKDNNMWVRSTRSSKP